MKVISKYITVFSANEIIILSDKDIFVLVYIYLPF